MDVRLIEHDWSLQRQPKKLISLDNLQGQNLLNFR